MLCDIQGCTCHFMLNLSQKLIGNTSHTELDAAYPAFFLLLTVWVCVDVEEALVDAHAVAYAYDEVLYCCSASGSLHNISTARKLCLD